MNRARSIVRTTAVGFVAAALAGCSQPDPDPEIIVTGDPGAANPEVSETTSTTTTSTTTTLFFAQS